MAINSGRQIDVCISRPAQEPSVTALRWSWIPPQPPRSHRGLRKQMHLSPACPCAALDASERTVRDLNVPPQLQQESECSARLAALQQKRWKRSSRFPRRPSRHTAKRSRDRGIHFVLARPSLGPNQTIQVSQTILSRPRTESRRAFHRFQATRRFGSGEPAEP